METFYVKLGRLLKLTILVSVLIPGLVQAAGTTSAIRGNIVDASGNKLANASIIVKNERTGVERRYSTNEVGTFYATALPVGGPYKITINGTRSVTIRSISLGDVYSLTVSMQSAEMEEVVAYGSTAGLADVAAGPSATYSLYDIETSVAMSRDIVEVYTIDPRVSLAADGQQVNCAGKHPRFNSITLDGVSQNDRFGLNSNGYSTATGMPFPFAAVEQVSVELAPFDVTYGGFSACNVNAVTKSGSNDWHGNITFDYTTDSLRGTTIDGLPEITPPDYTEEKLGISLGGPIIKDKLFFFGAYETAEEPRFIGMGYDGSGIGIERPWLSKAEFDRITQIAQNTYGYDTGGAPSDGIQENEQYMFRLDWHINDDQKLGFIYNYSDGFQDRASDGDSNEFEFSNHFYVKGTESESYILKLNSQWSDAFSTEVFLSNHSMADSQVTRGPGDFGDFQIAMNGRSNTVYLGADDSRQANKLSNESDMFKLVGTYLTGDHVITAGYEREELSTFNIFVQHSRGGEWDFYDDSAGNSAACNALDAQGRFDDPDPTCNTSGIDKFELGQPSRIYYGSGGGSNVATDAAASFSNTLNSFFIQDEWYIADKNLTLTYGLRYDAFQSDDRPNFNQAITDLNVGLRNDANIDGVSIVMPRLGFNWEASADLSVRGGVGLYSGGNPNVWLSNTWSNDGITNVQDNNRYSGLSVLDGGITLTPGGPGRGVPQDLYDTVANTTAANGSTGGVVLLDPDYKQPSEWKIALGATYQLAYEVQMDVDWLHSKSEDGAIYRDLSQQIVRTTILGQPIYDYVDVDSKDNLMLTNSKGSSDSDSYSVSFKKDFDFGLDLFAGYAYTQSEDISPMTSSVAGSNFDNLATLDINNPSAATSNWLVPHRFTFKASYATEFFDGLSSRFTVIGYAQEGRPQSFVMSGTDLEGDGFYGRHLLYVPTGASDPNVFFETGFDIAGFFKFVDKNELERGSFVARNEDHAEWSYRADFRFDQELPTFIDDVKGRAFLKIYNLTNFLNDDWGQAKDGQFFSQQVVTASVDEGTGQYRYERFRDRSITDLNKPRSLWEIRLGLELNF